MRRTNQNLHRLLSAAAFLSILALSACGPAAPAPLATETVSAIYTAAAQTFAVQQATQITATPPAAAGQSSTGGGGVPVTSGTAAAGSTNGSGNSNGSGSVPVTGGGTSVPGGTAASQCNNSTYVNDVTIPDGSVINASAAFTKTWTIMNSGTCPWTTAYRLAFFNGESMGGTSVALTAPVPAGTQTQVSVNLTAPVLAGSYTGAWQMVDPQGNRFGEMVTVVITVSATGGTSITATP